MFFIMSSKEFHDLLFEMSNEIRYEILITLQRKEHRLTDLTKQFELTTTEIRRHISRLFEVNLIEKKVDGFYHLTSYGKMILIMLQEFDFTSKYTEYFASHVFSGVPSEYIKRIGDLRNSELVVDVLEFIRKTEKIIEEANEFVYIIVDQFPLNYLRALNTAIEKGLRLKIIESQNPIFTADISELGLDDYNSLKKARLTPIIESKTIPHPSLYMFLTEKSCIFSFPSTNGEIDYRGFLATEKDSIKWCEDLFEYFWDNSKSRIKIEQTSSEETREDSIGESIIVEGFGDPSIDYVNLQTACDNYSEVILKGDFNIGSNTVTVRKSLVLRGEGREEDKPSTTLKRQGWTFPTSEYDKVIRIDAEGHEISIDNIHFTDWNNACILALSALKISITNNRLTLPTILGRGMRFGNWGDNVQGILVASNNGSFQDGVYIEGNYLDFATYYIQGGFRPRLGYEDNPDFRPDLLSHENCMSYGILVKQSLGDVYIKKNEVRNMNTEGIWVIDIIDSNVLISENKIISNVFGSYGVNRPYAGYGISAYIHWEASHPHDGFNLNISRNIIELGKVNYCGIAVHGPLEYIHGAVNLSGGKIKNNSIFLIDGAVGIHVYRCNEFDVAENKVGGRAYYGAQVVGSAKKIIYDYTSNMNNIEFNDFSELEIKKADKYSNENVNFRRFTGSNEEAKLGHVWLNRFSSRNRVQIRDNETVIDEGNSNEVIRENK